jgi:biotin synthase
MSREVALDAAVRWLREEDPERLSQLWVLADECRAAHVGDEVHLRGLIEISNHCARRCGYCGLRAGNRELGRYRMTEEEVLVAAHRAVEYGYGTVVLQAGEDYGLSAEWVARVVKRIKRESGLAVTLSLGERSRHDLERWREAGADRYLLRFETSDEDLYARIHPGRDGSPGRLSDRLELLRWLRRLGYETGSGVMVGIPGQTVTSLAHDLELFRELDLDMIGVGPYIAHPCTPLGKEVARAATSQSTAAPPPDQAKADESTVCKMVALTRLTCPQANIPSTTALATINQESGRGLGLQRGANVVMPNLTPPHYRVLYDIYPDKACAVETAESCRRDLSGQIEAIGRQIGTGPGPRRR